MCLISCILIDNGKQNSGLINNSVANGDSCVLSALSALIEEQFALIELDLISNCELQDQTNQDMSRAQLSPQIQHFALFNLDFIQIPQIL